MAKGIAQYLKDQREEAGLSQAELASFLGLKSPQFISNIERGLAPLPLTSIRRIAAALQVPHSEIARIWRADRTESMDMQIRKELGTIRGIRKAS